MPSSECRHSDRHRSRGHHDDRHRKSKHRESSRRSRSRSPQESKSHHTSLRSVKTEPESPPNQDRDRERHRSHHHHHHSSNNPHHDAHHRSSGRSHREDQGDHRRHSHHRGRGGRSHRGRHEEVDDSQYQFGKPSDNIEEEVKEEDKSKPDYGLSGKLADDTNTFRGVVVKYNEPPEARKPKLNWRLYPFKGDQALPTLHIHTQSGYLIGRDRKVADLPIDHPSCSKQHAVLQFRSIEYTKEDGTSGRHTRPYIIDLGSANGTFVNYKQIEAQRYVELLEKDTIKFGFSSRDYVILHDNIDVDSASNPE